MGMGTKRWCDDVPDALFRRFAVSALSSRFIARRKTLDQPYQDLLILTQLDGPLVPSARSSSAINHASYGYQQVNPTKHYRRAKLLVTKNALQRGSRCKRAFQQALVAE